MNACAAERFGFASHAFVDFGSIGIPTSGMYMKRACAPTDAAPFGLVAGNVVRSGPRQARPPGGLRPGRATRRQLPRTEVVRQGQAARLPLRAPDVRGRPDGSLVKKIRNFRANRNCAKSDNRTQVAQVGGIRRPVPFPMPGATRIVQRSVCVGGSRKRFCSARSINRIQTFWAEATIADGSPPAVAIAQDNPFTQGAWVNGTQSVSYTASDNVGVKHRTGPRRRQPAARPAVRLHPHDPLQQRPRRDPGQDE